MTDVTYYPISVANMVKMGTELRTEKYTLSPCAENGEMKLLVITTDIYSSRMHFFFVFATKFKSM